jgi:hypothetical protein
LVVASCRATHLFLCVYSLGLREVFIYYEFGAKWKIGKTSTPPFSAGLSAQGEALAFFWALAAQATCPPPSFSPPLSSWAGQATHGPAAVLPPPHVLLLPSPSRLGPEPRRPNSVRPSRQRMGAARSPGRCRWYFWHPPPLHVGPACMPRSRPLFIPSPTTRVPFLPRAVRSPDAPLSPTIA